MKHKTKYSAVTRP